jgi:hypothetical protein
MDQVRQTAQMQQESRLHRVLANRASQKFFSQIAANRDLAETQ